MGYKRILSLFIVLVFGFIFLVSAIGNKVNENILTDASGFNFPDAHPSSTNSNMLENEKSGIAVLNFPAKGSYDQHYNDK